MSSRNEEAVARSRAELNKFKREKFAKAWVSSTNLSGAARMAGISQPSAKKFLEEDGVQDLIELERLRLAKRMDLDADFVLSGIQEIAIECRTDKNHKDALKALELLGRHLKLFVDKENHTGANVSFNLSLDGKDLANTTPSGNIIEGELKPDTYDDQLDFEIPDELKSLSPEELEIAYSMNQVDESDDDPNVKPFGIFDLDMGDDTDEEDQD